MLPKTNRLPSHRIKSTIFSGKKTTNGSLIVYYKPSSAANTRVAFVIGKRASKLATGRNRIRRLLQQSIRSLLPDIEPGNDIVFRVLKPIGEDGTREQVKEEVERLLEKAQLFKTNRY